MLISFLFSSLFLMNSHRYISVRFFAKGRQTQTHRHTKAKSVIRTARVLHVTHALLSFSAHQNSALSFAIVMHCTLFENLLCFIRLIVSFVEVKDNCNSLFFLQGHEFCDKQEDNNDEILTTITLTSFWFVISFLDG